MSVIPQEELDRLFSEALGPIADQVRKVVAWWGTALESVAPAMAILNAADIEAVYGRTDETAALLDFYEGHQWPALIRYQRVTRPCLVVNRLPEIVALAIARCPTPLSAEDLRALKIAVTRENKDAQMLYNYTLSAFAEHLSHRKGT